MIIENKIECAHASTDKNILYLQLIGLNKAAHIETIEKKIIKEKEVAEDESDSESTQSIKFIKEKVNLTGLSGNVFFSSPEMIKNRV